VATYRITVDPQGAPQRWTVEGKPALLRLLASLGLDRARAARPADDGANTAVIYDARSPHHGKVVRWVAMGNTFAKPKPPKPPAVPGVFACGRTVQLGSLDLSFWSHAPGGGAWCVDVNERRFHRLTAAQLKGLSA
jgi:hypothetical protein